MSLNRMAASPGAGERLQRDLGDHVGRRARLEHRHAAAARRYPAASGPPGACTRPACRHRLAAAGAQERGIGERGGRCGHAFDALTGRHPRSRIRPGDIGTRRPRSTHPRGPRATRRQLAPPWSPGPRPCGRNGEEGEAVTRLVRKCPSCPGSPAARPPGRSSAPLAWEPPIGRDCPDALRDGGRRRRTLSLSGQWGAKSRLVSPGRAAPRTGPGRAAR